MSKKIFMGAAFFISLGLLFMACGGGGSPDNMPRAFYAAMARADVEMMKKITTGSFTAEAVRNAQQFKDLKISISGWKVKEVKDVAADKKSIRVEFVSKTEQKSGRGFPRKMKQDQIFHLKKVDKKWLIETISVASPPVSVE